jgi:hypothetical protein
VNFPTRGSHVQPFIWQTTELKSELELRIHLHEPRARRVELDVHNVRAGTRTVCAFALAGTRSVKNCAKVLPRLNDELSG